MTAQEIQSKYANHILLDSRRRGETKVLAGDVMVIVVFVNDPVSRWTERAKKDFCWNYFSAMKKIEAAARPYGVKLKLMNAFDEVELTMNCTMDNISAWTTQVVSKKGHTSIQSMQKDYKRLYNSDETPIVFAFNRKFRSYAQSADAMHPYGNEFCVASLDGSEKTIIHELLHQFGAEDLYYPEQIRAVADRYFPHSVMGGSVGDEIDPLTAYLIGWRENIDARVEKVLELTKHITYAHIQAELDQIWKNSRKK